MNLLEVREKFRDVTGRYDLVSVDNTDQGADFYINSAQRWLDRQLDYQGANAEFVASLSTGAYSTDIDGVRAVQHVAVGSEDEDYVFLEKRLYDPLRRYIANQKDSDRARPRYYAIGRFERLERVTAAEKLYFWPPTDSAYTAIIEGGFRSQKLSEQDDRSFWSVNFPEILIKAAAFRMEAMQRNTQGESDYRRSLMNDLQALDHDEVEESLASIDRVKSTWREIKL